MIEGYAQAIDLNRMERQLERCSALDVAHPPAERCARKTVMRSICPCMMCEDTICNALSAAVCCELESGGGNRLS